MATTQLTSLEISEVKDIEISLFKDCKAVSSTPLSLDAFFELIRSGKGFKPIIEPLRATIDPSERDKLKKKLPAVTISGLFSNGRKKENLSSYSGLMQIDFDKVADLNAVRSKLEKDQYSFSVFLSPSGNGLKIIAKVINDPKKHLESFLALEKYYFKKYQLEIDESCKDINRLMFLSWDENLFINKKSIVFLVENKFEEKEFEKAINYLNKKEVFQNGKRNNFIFKLASLCSQRGISIDFTEKKILEKYLQNDFPESEIKNTVKSAFSYADNKPQNQIINAEINKNETNSELTGEFETEKPQLIRVRDAIFEKWDFRDNEIRQVLEFKSVNEEKWTDFETQHLNSLWIDFQLNNNFKGKEKPSDKLLDKLLNSRFTPKFHAIKFYFDSLKWDGKDHIGMLCNTVNISPVVLNLDTALPSLWQPLFTRWLISSVACGIGKSPNHVMLLFVGSQGTYKTTWMNRLCPPSLDQYIFTGHINPDLNDNLTADFLAEKFIINIDDQLQSIFDKDFNKIKGIITATSITNRKAYRRDNKKRPRIGNFCGSVNKEKIFQDMENRRYLTFKIDSIDIQEKIDYDQVWAQAYHLYTSGERHWFDSGEVSQINTINNYFALVSQEEEWLMKLFESVKPEEPEAKFLMCSEIVAIISKASGLRLSPNKVSLAMKRLEWNDQISKRIGNAKEPRKVYAVIEHFTKDEYGNIKWND